jgi:hypothetical protein
MYRKCVALVTCICILLVAVSAHVEFSSEKTLVFHMTEQSGKPAIGAMCDAIVYVENVLYVDSLTEILDLRDAINPNIVVIHQTQGFYTLNVSSSYDRIDFTCKNSAGQTISSSSVSSGDSVCELKGGTLIC